MGAFRAVHGEEALHFGKDSVERARLVARIGLDDVAVHRVAAPHHRVPFTRHGAHKARQRSFDLVMPEPRYQRHAARFARGVEHIEHTQQRIRLQAGAALHADGVVDATHEFDMGGFGKARAVTDPEHMRGGVVPFAGQRIAARHRFLVR